jgi:hypothetical protein
MRNQHLLSANGSDRATAYNMSSKIVRRDDEIYVTWLEAPVEAGAPSRIVLGVCDAVSGALRSTFQLGDGIDNHCGAALVLDSDGRMHAVTGAHHGPFLYRWSDRPRDAATWAGAEPLGPADTYPSLAVGVDGTLHLAHRERGERWQLWYRRKKQDRPWEAPLSLAISPTPGYNHYMQSLTVGPTGVLHLTFQFYYAESGRAADCQGRMAVYLCSDDGGDTWYNEGMRCDTLPLTVETARPIYRRPDGGVRIGNHLVGAQNCPWLYSAMPDVVGGVLWHRTDAGWEGQDMTAIFDPLNMHGPRPTALSRAADGQLHLAVATDPGHQETPWFDPKLELFHLVLDENGAPLGLAQLTDTDPAVAGWIPAVEGWDWTRPEAYCTDGLWMTYTRGLNVGGIGGDNRNAVRTEVYLLRLPTGL